MENEFADLIPVNKSEQNNDEFADLIPVKNKSFGVGNKSIQPETQSTKSPDVIKSLLAFPTGIMKGVQSSMKFFDDAATLISKVTGWEKGDLFKKLSDMGEPPWNYTPQSFAEEVVQGIGEAVPEIAMITALPGSAPVTMGYMGAIRGGREEGIKGAIKEGAKGALLGGVFQGAGQLPKIAQVPTMGLTFGGLTALESGTPREVAKSTVIGAGLGLLGKGKEKITSETKPVNPIAEQLKTDPLHQKIDEQMSRLTEENQFIQTEVKGTKQPIEQPPTTVSQTEPTQQPIISPQTKEIIPVPQKGMKTVPEPTTEVTTTIPEPVTIVPDNFSGSIPAIEFGKQATPEQVTKLREKHKESTEKFLKLKDEVEVNQTPENVQAMEREGSRNQFLNEAIKSSEGAEYLTKPEPQLGATPEVPIPKSPEVTRLETEYTAGGYGKRGLNAAIEMRKEGGSLVGYDLRSQKEWLGGKEPSEKITLYRATLEGEAIQPGDYVTNNLEYAKQHIQANLGGKGKITKIEATLDDIFPADAPKEFWYAPKSIDKPKPLEPTPQELIDQIPAGRQTMPTLEEVNRGKVKPTGEAKALEPLAEEARQYGSVRFEKPATYSGIKEIEVNADAGRLRIRQDYKGSKTWSVVWNEYESIEGKNYPSYLNQNLISGLDLRSAKQFASDRLISGKTVDLNKPIYHQNGQIIKGKLLLTDEITAKPTPQELVDQIPVRKTMPTLEETRREGKGTAEIRTKIAEKKAKEVNVGQPIGVSEPSFEPAEGFTRRPVEPTGTGEPIKRSDIVKFLTEKLDVPIRTGRFRQKALGIFKVKPEVIRSRFANDIETIAHETGHGINKFLWGTKGKNLETAPLEAFSDELLPIATKSIKGQPEIQEGFAEFIRKYITNDADARKVAPKFYEFFEKELDKKSPEAKEIFIEARNQFDKWIKQPATQRVLGQISIDEKVKKPVTWNNLYTQWVDELHPLKKVVDTITREDKLKTTEDPYELARLMAGWTGKADAFLEHKTFGFKDYQWKNKSLKDILDPVKNDMDNLRAYAVAKRSLELKRRNIETGIAKEDAIKVIQEQGKHEKTLQELHQYQDDVLNYLVDSGVLGLKDAVKMKILNRDYVPFYRVMESDKTGLVSGKGFEAGQPIKRIKGSWRDIVDPLESIIKNTYTFIQAAEKNTVVKSMVNLANKYEGSGKFVERIPMPMQRIIVKEPELLGILQKYGKWTETTKFKETQKTVGEKITQVGAAGEEITGGRATKLMESQAMEALIARGRTEPEAKMILDRIKKAPTAEIKSKIIEKTIERIAVKETVKEFGLDIPNNIIELFRPSAFVPKENVISVWKNGKRELYQVHPDIARVVQALDRESTNTLVKVLSYPSRWLRAGATLTPEFILRNPIRDQFSAFVYSKYGFVPGIDLGRGIAHLVKGDDVYWKWKIGGGEHSMLVSLDREYLQKSIGDVLREKNAANIAGSIITNPLKALQVLSELTEAGTRIGEFGRGLVKEGMSKEAIAKSAFASREVTLDFARKGATGKEVNKLVAFWNANIQGTDKFIREFKEHPIPTTIKVVSAITLPSIGLYMANRNDPRWKELPSWQKDLFWIILTRDHVWRIPKPFELGIVFGSIPERILETIDSKNPRLLDSLWKSVISGATPGFIPNVVLPIAENWANKSFFMDRPIVSKGREGMMPTYQYQPYTTELAKKIGKGIDILSGGKIGVSPAKMENLIRGWTGGLGTHVLSIADKGLRMVGILPDPPQPTKTFADWPVTKAFSVRFPGSDSESIRKFYENYEESNQIRSTAVGLVKEYKIKEAEKLLEKHDYIKMNTSYEMMSNAQRFIQLVYANPTIESEEKRQLIDKTYFQMIDMASGINTLYNSAKKPAK